VGAPPISDPTGDEDMERRRLLESLAILGVTAALPDYASGTLRTAFNASLPPNTQEDNTAEDWQEAALEYAHAFLTTTPQRLLPDLAADTIALRSVIQRNKNSRRIRDFYRAAAILAAIMAETINALGMSRESRHWWRSARHAADASSDIDIQIWVYGQEAMNGIYQERPLPIVLDKAETAIRLASGHSCPGLLEALACKAQVLAELGMATKADDILRDMEEHFSALPSNLTADRSSRMVWPQHRLWHTQSYVYTSSGKTARAEKAQEQALALYPISRLRPRAQIELHRAACIVQDGDAGSGISHAERVIESLPPGYYTRAVQVIAGKVLEALPVSERKKPAVNSYREVLELPVATQEA
jgi:hypothetical protein